MDNQQVGVSQVGYLTYKEAAAELGLSADYIAHLVSDRRLESIRLPHSRYKYLSREEVERWKRVRAGLEPEVEELKERPYTGHSAVESVPQLTAGASTGAEAEEAQRLAQSVQPAQFAGISPELALALVLIVLALLLSFVRGQQPDDQALEQLKTTPQLQPVRRAILKLASEIAA